MGLVIRRMAIGLMLLSVGGSLVACGSAGHPATTTPAGAAGTKTASGKPLTKPQAIALARAVNLRASDLPGFTASTTAKKQPESLSEKQLEREMLKCVGVLGVNNALAEASSKDFKFEHGILNLSVHSEVSVASTPALAAKNLTALRGKHVRACLSRYLNSFFKHSAIGGARVSPVSLLSGTPPAPGATGSFAWRITATYTLHGIPIPFYFDILSFAYGHAEVTLFSSGLPEPFPAKAQEKLFSLLLARAEEHSA
jgi:hypothetical protein